MNVNAEEAKSSLSEIERTMRNTRRSAAMYGTGPIVMVWGLVWMICFSLNQYVPQRSKWIWSIGDLAGVAITMAICFGFASRRPIQMRSDRKQRWRFFWFWFALIVFIDAGIAIMSASGQVSEKQITAFIVLGIMFAYVAIGLMLDSWLMIGLGLGVSALSVVGFFALNEYFYLWMACTGGIALFLSGVHVQRQWR